MQYLELIKANWKQLPRILKCRIVEKLHEDFSVRQISRLLNIPKSNVHYYTKEKKHPMYNIFSPGNLNELDLDALEDFCKQLFSHADPIVLPPPGDEASRMKCGGE